MELRFVILRDKHGGQSRPELQYRDVTEEKRQYIGENDGWETVPTIIIKED